VATLETASSSFAQQSGSNSIRFTNLESTASVLTTASASFAIVSGSFVVTSGSLSVRTTTLEAASASFAITSGSDSVRITKLESTASILTIASASFAVVSSSYSALSGSFRTGSYTGSFIGAGNLTGSLFGTASWAQNSVTSSYSLFAVSASFATTASFATNTSTSLNAVTASHALTASSADNFLIRQNVTASNALIIGTLTAQTIIAQVITSSIDFVTGSTRFGSLLTNTHQFTGSVSITGSLSLNNSPVVTNDTFTPFSSSVSLRTTNLESTASVLTSASASFAVVSGSYSLASGSISTRLTTIEGKYLTTGSNVISGSQLITGSIILTGSLSATQGVTASLFGTASWAQNATTSSYSLTALSSSYAQTASYANDFTVKNKLFFDQTLTDYATVASSIVGSNNLFTQATGSYSSAFFKYTVTNTTNARTGEVMAVWSGASVEFTDFSTADLGVTSPVSCSVSIVGADVLFNVQTNTSGWKIKSIGTFM
jgi:hypothetical protein